jgi:hypothetical protein
LLLLCEQKVNRGRGENWASNGDWWADNRKCEALAIRVKQAAAGVKRRRPPTWRQHAALRCWWQGGGYGRYTSYHDPITRSFSHSSGSRYIRIKPNGPMCDEFLQRPLFHKFERLNRIQVRLHGVWIGGTRRGRWRR